MSYDFKYESSHQKETVTCKIEECRIDDKDGIPRCGVRVTCNKCGHSTESFGQSDRSIKRCLALLCEECPEDEENWYEEE